MKTFCPSLLILLLSALLGLLAPPLVRAQNDQSIEALEEEMPRLLEQGNVPGLSIAVIRNGELFWSGAFGVKSLETKEPVATQTIFEAASLSKPVFAYAVLRLAERGEIDLDTPLADHLPYERLEHEARYRQITPRIVMSHSTGLPNWGGDRLDLNFDPGTAFNYSGEGFVYLQKTIEHLTGLTLDEVARREVFEPLGMTRSSYVWQDAFEGNAVARHSSQGNVSPIRRPSEGNAAASLMTTAEDYARFLSAIVNSEGLEAETIDAMLRPEISVVSSTMGNEGEAKQKNSWGLGWGLHPMEAGHAFWHWGDNGDAKAFTMTDYGTGDGFVYFANSADGLSLGEIFARYVFDEPAWGLRWLGYEQHDDPARIARQTMARVFVDDGIEAGLATYDDLRTSQPDVVVEDLVNALGYELLGGNHVEAAIAVFERNVAAYPESSNVYDSLGEAYLRASQYEGSITNSEKSVELDPDNKNGARSIGWIKERVAVETHPVTVPVETLRRYAGHYGPRHVLLDGATLFHEREGNPRYRLIPLADDLFALDGLETFRMRFVADEAGRIVKIVGHYINGNQDETPRDS